MLILKFYDITLILIHQDNHNQSFQLIVQYQRRLYMQMVQRVDVSFNGEEIILDYPFKLCEMYYISSLSNQELQYQIENFSYMKQIKYINQLINKYLNYIKKNIQLIFVLINSRTYISGYFQQQKGLQCCKEAHLKQLKQICFYKYHFFQTNLFKKLLCLYNYFTQENLGNNKFLDQFQIAALILQYLFVMKESNQKSYSFIQQFKLKSKIFNTIREIVQKANQIKIIFSFSNDDYSDLITEISFKKFGRALQNSFEITPLEIFSGSELHLNYNLICFKLIISENFIDLLRYDQVY